MNEQEFREEVIKQLENLNGRMNTLESKLDLSIQKTEGKIKGHVELLEKDVATIHASIIKHEAEAIKTMIKVQADMDAFFTTQRSCERNCTLHREEIDKRFDLHNTRLSNLESSAKTLGWALGFAVGLCGIGVGIATFLFK